MRESFFLLFLQYESPSGGIYLYNHFYDRNSGMSCHDRTGQREADLEVRIPEVSIRPFCILLPGYIRPQ
jgi:hypothetical protein